VGGDDPTNPTDPDWPDPDFPTVATAAEDLPWPLNEIFSGRTLTAPELLALQRFLSPYTLNRLRTTADYAQDDANRARRYSDEDRERAKKWRDRAEDAKREAEKWRKKARETDDPDLRAEREKNAERYEKRAQDLRERAGSWDEKADEWKERGDKYQERHDQAQRDAEQAIRDAQQKVQAEKEAERLAREKAEQERIQKELEKARAERKAREAKWERYRQRRAEQEQKEAEERRAKQAAEAWQKEFERQDSIAKQAHQRLKDAEARRNRDPNNLDYQRRYRIRLQQYNQAEAKVGALMNAYEGYRSSGQSLPSKPVPASGGETGPTISKAAKVRDKALEAGSVTADLYSSTKGASVRAKVLGAAGKVVDAKTVIDLGRNIDKVDEQSKEQIQKESDAMDDKHADPTELQHHRWDHLKKNFKTLF
jgi:hypothetical protein